MKVDEIFYRAVFDTVTGGVVDVSMIEDAEKPDFGVYVQNPFCFLILTRSHMVCFVGILYNLT